MLNPCDGFRTSDLDEDSCAKLCGKIVLLVSEDWFALSHFRPLITALSQIALSVVVVTRSSGRLSEIEALGASVVDFDFRRGSNSVFAVARLAWALHRILKRESPDVVHLVAMKPIVVGGLALKFMSIPRVVIHVTGQGLVAVTRNRLLRLYRLGMRRVMASLIRRPTSYLLVENPDDLAELRAGAADPGSRYAILGGAGVDADAFGAQSPPGNEVPVAAYVGRMINSKGVGLLMQAYDQLLASGTQLQLSLYGTSDSGNPEAIPPKVIEAWCLRSGAHWHGQVTDIVAVWRRADIFVLPSLGGEGLPRALLEAAACARPLVVTDVPGNRHFVRNGVEGLVVPPQDVAALASALQRLASDGDLRAHMGEAARRRVLSGYTESHVRQTVRESYRVIFQEVVT